MKDWLVLSEPASAWLRLAEQAKRLLAGG